MNRKGIISAGTVVMDIIKFIDVYPERGNLTTISREGTALGGCVHNVLVDLARLGTDLPLYAAACVGNDENGHAVIDNFARHGIDCGNVRVLEDCPTSYTDVMSETSGSCSRTFFHNRGANARLTPEMVSSIDVPARIFHLGYLLLLDGLDAPDPQYGVASARVLDSLQRHGYKTSVDLVSEESDRYASCVLACLNYVDYLSGNEVEAGRCLGTALRTPDGKIDIPSVKEACLAFIEKGVGECAVIHFPEGGVAAQRGGGAVFVPSVPVKPEEILSSVGAGDAFCAGMLFAMHEEYPLEKALRFANASARFNLFDPSSTGGAPDLKTLTASLG